jgi:hypothetical protein
MSTPRPAAGTTPSCTSVLSSPTWACPPDRCHSRGPVVAGEKWPLAYQDGGRLFVGLAKDQNFYQLPVKVKAKRSVSGGHEWTLDVFSDKAISKLVYSGLTGVTADGSPIDDSLKVGQKTFLLGFFSVNLKKALDASEGAGSEEEAVPVKDALEFLVFGVAANSAVASCSKH